MSDNITIRHYTSHCQEALEEFLKITSAGPKFPFDPEKKHTDFRNIPKVYQVSNGQFWLLYSYERIIGMIALKSLSDTVGEVKRLNVHPNYRGSGYGDMLFKHLIEYAKENGFSKLRLDSRREFNPAYGLYLKYGFNEIPRYNDNPNADIFMELKL